MVGLVVRLWAATWRVRLVLEPGAEAGPRVLAFWHGKQLALVAVRSRPTVAMVSWSADGELSSGVLKCLGLSVVRGSSSRGGARALRAMIAALRSGLDAVFAVDGPRGPARRAKPGALHAARRAGARMVPVGSAASHATVVARAWDGFTLPWPFARVVVVAGAPMDVSTAGPESIDLAIERVERRAAELLESA